jgi:hypothetical protein
MPPQTIDKWQIGTLIGLLQYSIKVTNRLMGVDQKNEIELAPAGTPLKRSFIDGRVIFSTLVRCPRIQSVLAETAI